MPTIQLFGSLEFSLSTDAQSCCSLTSLPLEGIAPSFETLERAASKAWQRMVEGTCYLALSSLSVLYSLF